MVKHARIEFLKDPNPIKKAVTKFGGQPAWLEKPLWPLSKKTGQQMRFICQIALDPNMFGIIEAEIAYLFLSDDSDNRWPDRSENAVILQPGGFPINLKTTQEEIGPTLLTKEMRAQNQQSYVQSEYRVLQTISDDPEFLDLSAISKLDKTSQRNYLNTLVGNKIGGTPYSWVDNQFPIDNRWKLILAIDSTDVPFFLDFGGTGIGYMFLSPDGKRGKYLCQPAVRKCSYDLVLNGSRQIFVEELSIIQMVMKNNNASNCFELEQALVKEDVPWNRREYHKNPPWGRLIDLLTSRKQIVFQNSDNKSYPKCSVCNQEIIPFFPSVKLCMNCTSQELAIQKCESWITQVTNRISDVVSCDHIFAATKYFLYPIILKQISKSRILIQIPVDKYPILEPKHLKSVG